MIGIVIRLNNAVQNPSFSLRCWTETAGFPFFSTIPNGLYDANWTPGGVIEKRVLIFARVKREEELIELGHRRSDPGCLSGDENSGLRS